MVDINSDSEVPCLANKEEANQPCTARPYGSRVRITKKPCSIHVLIPPVGFSCGDSFCLFVSTLCAFWPLLIIPIAVVLGLRNFIPGLICFPILLLIIFSRLGASIKEGATYRVLHIGPQTYAFWKGMSKREEDLPALEQENPDEHQVLGETLDLSMARFIPEEKGTYYGRSYPAYILIKMREARCCIKFGGGLSDSELKWILAEVNGVIGQVINHV